MILLSSTVYTCDNERVSLQPPAASFHTTVRFAASHPNNRPSYNITITPARARGKKKRPVVGALIEPGGCRTANSDEIAGRPKR